MIQGEVEESIRLGRAWLVTHTLGVDISPLMGCEEEIRTTLSVCRGAS